MSVDTLFKPLGPLTLIGTSAVQVVQQGNANAGVLSFRVRNLLSTAAYFSWGPAAVGAPVAPTAGVPSPNTIGMLPTSVETFEIPAYSYFIASAAAAFEIQPGQGS